MLTALDTTTSVAGSPGQTGAVLIRDNQPRLPLSGSLQDSDLIVLLTPVVAPVFTPRSSRGTTTDPFEPFGRALARHHPWIRHVPYTVRDGITGTHVGFIKRAATVIFVISGPSRQGQPPQVELAEVALSVSGHRPLIVVVCCNVHEIPPLETASFPTVIQLSGFASGVLEYGADLLFRAHHSLPAAGPSIQDLTPSPKTWPVEVWNTYRDYTTVHELWLQCLPTKFHVDSQTLQFLLVRDGCAMHYVVRNPETADVLGFCATYTTYIDSGSDRLVG
jgi:hypothetical protein